MKVNIIGLDDRTGQVISACFAGATYDRYMRMLELPEVLKIERSEDNPKLIYFEFGGGHVVHVEEDEFIYMEVRV